MKNERFIDLAGLTLSGIILIVLLVSLFDRVNPLMNYREVNVAEAVLVYGITILMVLLLIVQAVGIVLRFTQERSSVSLRRSTARLMIPIVILSTLLLVNQSGFPGIWASPEVRQQWAIEEFQDYDDVVKSIQNCAAVIDRVGQVQFVAPTRGANYIVSEPGSSGHHGELTLEVIGDKTTGVANLQFHIGTVVGWVRLTHQDKTERLKCF